MVTSTPEKTPAARSMRPHRTRPGRIDRDKTGYHLLAQDISPSGGSMTGPEHYAEAERLLAVADRHTSGVTYGPEWTLTLTAAHVHATLALAAATALGTAGPDRHAWADIAATTHRSKPEPPSGSPPDPGPEQRRPPPLFPPEDRPRH
jgi:hypothetical protein